MIYCIIFLLACLLLKAAHLFYCLYVYHNFIIHYTEYEYNGSKYYNPAHEKCFATVQEFIENNKLNIPCGETAEIRTLLMSHMYLHTNFMPFDIDWAELACDINAITDTEYED